jgi:hypothetical protein
MRSLSLAAIVGVALLAGGPLAAQTQEPEKTPASAAQDAQPPAPAAQEAPPPLPAPAATDATPPETSARFSFNRVDGGFLRFDSGTGQVALCSQRPAGWACQPVPEERAALDSEIARLQDRVTALQIEIAALRAPPVPPRPPGDLAPRGEGDSKSGAFKLPSDDDIKWARAAIERLWRDFVDMVADFQKDMQRKG